MRSLTIAMIAAIALNAPCRGDERRYDVVVYSGTAGGVVSAAAAIRDGASAVVLEPGEHVGGMVAGGLGWTDKGASASIGGMSRDFYRRVFAHYERPEAWRFEKREAFLKRAGGMVDARDRVWWAVEPSVASAVLDGLAREAKVEVLRGRRIKSVQKRGGRILSIACDNGEVFAGRVFIDASYEGDLLAKAGVPYRVGREGREVYGEELAGVVPEAWSTRKQWDVNVSAFDDAGRLVFGVHDGLRGVDGQGDSLVQAYNYRICLTDIPENRLPIERPQGYDPARYELLARYIAAKGDVLNLTGPKGRGLLKIDVLPNRKTDINDGAPFSTDFLNASWRYPEGDEAERRRIVREHVEYTQGLLYFLGNDPRVPERLRERMKRWGYVRDEFTTTDHWPPQLYIREARRMAGAYVMTQHDIQTRRRKKDSIGMGSYNADSHHVRRIVDARGFVRNEGNPNDRAVGHKPYEIPYRCLTPRPVDADNLLATFCVSASHMGFASLRMEPVFMILSESAGAAAAVAAKQDLAVQDVPIGPLQRRLTEAGQRLWLKDLTGSR